MAKGKRGGNAWKNGYSAYRSSGRWLKNRLARIKKHLQRHPEDAQAQKAVDRTDAKVRCGKGRERK